MSETYISAPGETLSDILEDRGISLLEFSRDTGLSLDVLQGIVSGDFEISEEIARRFEQVLGVATNFWLNREQKYRERLGNASPCVLTHSRIV